jgi:hypothetical protein
MICWRVDFTARQVSQFSVFFFYICFLNGKKKSILEHMVMALGTAGRDHIATDFGASQPLTGDLKLELSNSLCRM